MYKNIDSLEKLMKQAKQIQEKIQKIKEEIFREEIKGESGAGIVKVILNGAYNCRRVEIDSSVFQEDKAILEELLISAFNDATRRIEKTKKEKISSVSGDMKFPFWF